MELGKIGSSKDEITNHQSPTFLGVPTEIRLEIYKYLVPQGTVDPQYNEKSGLKIFEEDKECLENEVSSAILLVNKQVHREVVSLWVSVLVLDYIRLLIADAFVVRHCGFPYVDQ